MQIVLFVINVGKFPKKISFKCISSQFTAFRPDLLSLQRNNKLLDVIGGSRRDVDGNCTLLGSYAVSSGNYVPTFWDNLLVPPSVVKNLDH